MVIIVICVLVAVAVVALIIGLSVGLRWSWWALRRVSNCYHRGCGCEACWGEAFPQCVCVFPLSRELMTCVCVFKVIGCVCVCAAFSALSYFLLAAVEQTRFSFICLGSGLVCRSLDSRFNMFLNTFSFCIHLCRRKSLSVGALIIIFIITLIQTP